MHFLFFLALAFTGPALAVAGGQDAASEVLANPIRKAVKMLQMMQKKVEAEGIREQELYEKFNCYCKTGNADLAANIAAAEDKIPAVGSEIETSESKLAQTKNDLTKAQSDRSAAKASMAEATAIREKEAKAFAIEKADHDANIAAMSKAVTALEKGMAGSFLQSTSAQVLRRLAVGKLDMSDADRQELVAFLSSRQSSNYVPKGGDILGILKQMEDTMVKALAEATAAENSAIDSYESLIAAKTKEVTALTTAVEAKMQLIGELGMAIVQMKEDLSDTEASLREDQKFFATLKTDCATKKSEWEERSKTRTEELAALAETIKILSDDEALELFKKTLPSGSSSLLEVQVGTGASISAILDRTLHVLRAGRKAVRPQSRTSFDLLLLAVEGREARTAGGFEKIIKMIDEMVGLLGKEQRDDDKKKRILYFLIGHG